MQVVTDVLQQKLLMQMIPHDGNDNESGGNHKESTGKKVEVGHVMRREEHHIGPRKEGDGNESTGRRKRGRPKRRWLDKLQTK